MWTRLKTLFSFQGDFNLICKENVISKDCVPLVDLIIYAWECIHASVKTIKILIIYLLLDICASIIKFPSCLHHCFNSPGVLKNLGFSNAYKHTHGSTCDGGSIFIKIKHQRTVELATPHKKNPFKTEIRMERSSFKKKTEERLCVCVSWISGGRIIASSIMALVRSLPPIKTY